MRTIKFRIWNGKKILFPNQITKYANCELGINYAKEYTPEGVYILRNPSKIHLMQFTGLYDKNGKEIYEGDILEDSLGRRKVVEYYQDGFWLNASLEGAEWSLRLTHKSSKIIGNIYENAELLKSK